MTARPVPEQLYFTTYQVAQRLGCTPQHVRDLIDEGKLSGERGLGRKILVPASELRRLAGDDAPGHEALSSAHERDDTVRELRRLHAEMGRLLATLEG
jgi:excisionase family DNA binding protein